MRACHACEILSEAGGCPWRPHNRQCQSLQLASIHAIDPEILGQEQGWWPTP
jgi:hypothetical protein